MRILTKRIISIALAVCLCLAMSPAVTMQVAAADPISMMISWAQERVGKSGQQLGYNDQWCAYFVSDCAIYAGQSEAVPYNGNAHYLYLAVLNAGGKVVSSPQAGDLVFYNCTACDTNGDGISMMHVGLVENENYSIEGNLDGSSYSTRTVKRKGLNERYSHGSGHSTDNYVERVYVRPAYNGIDTIAPDKPTITTTTAYYAEGSDIAISWNAVSGNTYYWINVYKDGELIVNQSMGNETTYTLENAAKGEYKFAISANNSAGNSGGTSYSFLVGLAPEVPTITTTATYYAAGTDVTVNWSAVLGNTYYWVNIYKDEELIVNETAGNRTSFTFEAAEAGTYKFVVSANNGAGNNGGAKYLFLVEQPPEKPVLSEVQSNYDVGESITISWDPVVGNVYYWVTAYKDGEKFTNQALGNATSYSIPSAAEGQYIIYISASNGAGTSGSASCKFIVGPIQYTVDYDANGGTNAPESQTKIRGEDLALSNSVPTRTGYTFLGWATSSAATEAEYQPGDAFTIDSDTILYAVWEKEPVTLNSIEVISSPTKTVYEIGESLDTTGLTLKATYSDGSTKTITSGFTTSGFDSSTTGEKTVTVTYEGKSASFTVTVEETEEVEPNVAQIVVESATASYGSTVEIDVGIVNNPGFSVLNVAFIYDTEYLTLLEVENHLSSMTMTSDSTVVWDAVENYTGNGVLCTLKFEIAEDAPEGEYEIQVIFISASNDEFEELNMSGVSGTLEICNILYGDVNGDGKIASVDLAMLRKYLASVDPITGASSIAVKAGADCNGDGKITSVDLAMLRKYLASVDPITGESLVVLGPR